MKQILKLIVAILFMAIAVNSYAAKNEDITLVVTSDGATKDEAIKNALRNAIEQTYGVFVSANTDILNDEVISDEIATVASGNIKSYKELSTSQSDGKTTVTLEAVVSVGKLISYAKSKGAEVEFNGAAMYADIELKELYKKNEELAVTNLVQQTKEMLRNGFDYSLNILSNQAAPNRVNLNSEDIILPVEINGTLNEAGEKSFSDLLNALSFISVSGLNYDEFCEVSSKLQKTNRNQPILEYYKSISKVANKCKQFYSRAECNTVNIMSNAEVRESPFFELPLPGSPSTRDGNYPEFAVVWILRSQESVKMLNSLFSDINEMLSSYEIEAENEKLAKYGDEKYDMNFMQQWHSNCPPLKKNQNFYSFNGYISVPKELVKSIKRIKIKQI